MFTINYWAVLVCAVLSLVLGSVWYGPLFGKAWARIIGTDDMSPEECKDMQRKAMPLYLVQFVLALLSAFLLAHMTGFSAVSGVLSAAIVWAGFIMPTIAGATMWTNEPRRRAWQRFGIQAGFQLLCFIVFGLVLGLWL